MKKRKEEKNRVKAKVLREYARNEPLKAIAIRYGIAPSTISLWAKAAGLKRRVQGCRIKRWPSDVDMAVIAEVRANANGKVTLAEIGRHWNMSRANVHRIYRTWKDRELPASDFAPGDTVRLLDRDYEVVEAGALEGVVRDLKTGQVSSLRWRSPRGPVVKLNLDEESPVGGLVAA